MKRILITGAGPKSFVGRNLKEALQEKYEGFAPPHSELELLDYEALEKYVKSRQLHFKVYSLCNCGFYEGVQCELELEVIECWCEKCNLKFCGGAGIGAGEMIGVLRLSPVIGLIEMIVPSS